ncbi:archease [Actinobacteria bacterium YIM 96077]|uniref:Archease n=1 Tax=Phytoactinopolyspora halophila TaxID=1981511 RepID=A0A329QNV7_9ACTN|nr:archease [Phytoactinopolyspora halophila]AYY14577.1 archease [Actinobacteria bacterium YIM 96077]RAW14045.1 archease [Phytoactinopolyspora halophila]
MRNDRTRESQPAPPSGHHVVPHTADLRIEAWSPALTGCLGEAAHALVGSFADLTRAEAAGVREFAIPSGPAEDQLVALLDEIIYRMDAHGEIPRNVAVHEDSSGLLARLSMVRTEAVATMGAVPKAVALHELSVAKQDDQWICSVTIDI